MTQVKLCPLTYEEVKGLLCGLYWADAEGQRYLDDDEEINLINKLSNLFPKGEGSSNA